MSTYQEGILARVMLLKNNIQKSLRSKDYIEASRDLILSLDYHVKEVYKNHYWLFTLKILYFQG